MSNILEHRDGAEIIGRQWPEHEADLRSRGAQAGSGVGEVVLHQPQVHVRRALAEASNHLAYLGNGSARRGESDDQPPAATRGDPPDIVHRFRGALQDVPRPDHKRLSGTGQLDAFGGADEELNAEILLEIANGRAERLLREMQPFRCPRKVQLPRDRQKVAELAQLQRVGRQAAGLMSIHKPGL